MDERFQKLKILENDLKIAEEHASNIRNSQIEFVNGGFKMSNDFYYKLATLNTGALTFSISFMAYVASIGGQIQNKQLLQSSWLFLLLSLICAIYRNHYHGYFLHYQLQKRWLMSRAEVEKLAQKLIVDYPESIFNKFDGKVNLKKASKQREGLYNKHKKSNERKEEIYNWFFTACKYCAHVGFVLGMILMVLFAISNI